MSRVADLISKKHKYYGEGSWGGGGGRGGGVRNWRADLKFERDTEQLWVGAKLGH
jgi:hypothetical protein